jgi:hypothetical protein
VNQTADDQDVIEVDEQQLTRAIAQVVAKEIGAQTRAAINAALGRLD